MTIHNQNELEVTRGKLKMLEDHLETRKKQPTEGEPHKALSLRSVQRWINRLKEEIVRYEAHSKAAH